MRRFLCAFAFSQKCRQCEQDYFMHSWFVIKWVCFKMFLLRFFCSLGIYGICLCAWVWGKEIYSAVKQWSTQMRRNFSILNIICIIEFQKRTNALDGKSRRRKKSGKLFAFFSIALNKTRESKELWMCARYHSFIMWVCYSQWNLLTSVKWMAHCACSCNQMFSSSG